MIWLYIRARVARLTPHKTKPPTASKRSGAIQHNERATYMNADHLDNLVDLAEQAILDSSTLTEAVNAIALSNAFKCGLHWRDQFEEQRTLHNDALQKVATMQSERLDYYNAMDRAQQKQLEAEKSLAQLKKENAALIEAHALAMRESAELNQRCAELIAQRDAAPGEWVRVEDISKRLCGACGIGWTKETTLQGLCGHIASLIPKGPRQ